MKKNKILLLLLLITITASSTLKAQWEVAAEFPQDSKEFSHIFFLDENLGWVSDEIGPYLYTTDGGETWHENSAAEIASDVVFLHPDTGFICYEHYLKKTTDGGENWEQIYSTFGFMTDLFFKDGQAWADWDEEGAVLISEDNGNTWDYKIVTQPNMGNIGIYNVFLVSKDTGWVSYACYDNDYNFYFDMYKTTNSGETWTL